jgi:hypothetical protein
MSAHDLICCPRKHQVAHLRTCIYAVYMLKVKSVPKSDALISGATSCSQKTSLLRAPTDSFHSSLMLIEFGEIIFSMRYRLPNEEFIIVSTRSNLVFIVHAPLETTHLLLMSQQPLLIVFMSPNVSDENGPVPAPSGNERPIPRACTDPVRVASESPNLLSLIDVPDGDLTVSVTHTQVLSSL